MNGISGYTTGIAKFPVHLPKGRENCRHCPFLRYIDYRKTYHCILSEGYIDISELDRRPAHCPVEISSEV